jgi:hypothetical protein
MPTLAPSGASVRGSPLSVSWIRISRIAAMLLAAQAAFRPLFANFPAAAPPAPPRGS